MNRSIMALAAVVALSVPALAQVATVNYVTVTKDGAYASKLRGVNVYNQDNKSIGEITDIAITPTNTVDAYFLSVGGFLGIGEHYVAVSPSAVKVTYDSSSAKWLAKMDASVEQLKAAPEFKYPK